MWCFISCLDSHSDGTHSLQSIHWWESDVMLHFSKSSPMNKQTHLLFAWPKNIVIYLTSIMRATKLLPSTIMHMKTSRQPLTGYYQTSSIVLDLSSALALMSFYHRGFSKSTSRPVFPQAVRFAAFWAAHYSQAIV